jgi:hypothetical protein
VLTCASVAQGPLARGGFHRIFIASSERDHARLVHSEAQRPRRESMSRFTMTLAVAATSAVAAIAAVALPALGADSKTPRRQADPGSPAFNAFVSCLRSHGLADAPADPAALKPWLGAKQESDRDTVNAAMAACDDKLPPKPTDVAQGPDVEDVIACVRGHGIDAPTDPDAFKRWLDDAAHSGAADAALRDCKMSLAPGPSESPGKPGGCVKDVRPADEAAKPETAKQGAAKPGI